MTNTFVSGKLIVGEVFDNYNIKSQEFVSRSPMWIRNCLRSLKIRQVYVERWIEEEFDDYRLELPFDCDSIQEVYIDNYQIPLYNTVDFCKGGFSSENLNDVIVLTPETNISISNIRRTNPNYLHNPDNVYYTFQDNWLKTIIPNGNIKIKYYAIPCQYDADEDLVFPMVYDIELLKEYIRAYILTLLLQRGLVHPIFSLRENNPYTNPALKMDTIRNKVRTACNKFTKERRENISKILLSNGN